MRNPTQITALIAFILFPATPALPTTVTFTSDATIQSGDLYEEVRVENDGTTVTMTGGQITRELYIRDQSTFLMSAGLIGEESEWSSLYIRDGATFNMTDGAVDTDQFVVFENSHATIEGGSTSGGHFKAYENSTTTLKGGIITLDWVYWIAFDAQINIYGYGFEYENYTLTGHFFDGGSFSIGEVRPDEYEYFNLIPEPIALLSLIFAAPLLLRTRR